MEGWQEGCCGAAGASWGHQGRCVLWKKCFPLACSEFVSLLDDVS